jgi:hypothetical protein
MVAIAEPARITSALLWGATAIAAVIDAPLLALVTRAVSPALFRQLKWWLAGVAALMYCIIWGVFGTVLYWDAAYSYVFPAWFRWPLPIVYGALFGAVALLFWRLSVAASRWPALWFCLLGGLVSLVGHGIGVRRGLLRAPLLSQASAASALVFGVFEFIVYWCAIVLIAMALQRFRGQAAAGPSASGPGSS